MTVTIKFELDGSQIEVNAILGLDSDGHLIAYSKRSCRNRAWVKKHADEMYEFGDFLENTLGKSKDNTDEDSQLVNQVDDKKIDWDAFLKAANGYIDTDIGPKFTYDEKYEKSELRKLANTLYGKFGVYEDFIRRIQNSLKDTEGNIAKMYKESLNEIKDEIKHIHNSVDSIEDYIVNNCDDEEDDDNSDEDTEPKSIEEKPMPHNHPLAYNSILKCINGIYYRHNFYKNQTTKSLDCNHWIECTEDDIPNEYKVFINQKYIINICTIIGGFSYCITNQDPINADTKLPVHIETTNKLLKKIFKMTYDVSLDSLGYNYICMTKHELINYIHDIIFDNPETNSYFKVLNTSYNDAQMIRNGETPNSLDILFCTRYSGPHWKDDFIDLDALERNVINFIIKYSTYPDE